MNGLVRAVVAGVLGSLFALILPLLGFPVPDGYGSIVAITFFVSWYFILWILLPERTKK